MKRRRTVVGRRSIRLGFWVDAAWLSRRRKSGERRWEGAEVLKSITLVSQAGAPASREDAGTDEVARLGTL